VSGAFPVPIRKELSQWLPDHIPLARAYFEREAASWVRRRSFLSGTERPERCLAEQIRVLEK
jgi:hypothetical protein